MMQEKTNKSNTSNYLTPNNKNNTAKRTTDRIITNTIFLMAQALGLKVVVEGVEGTEQLELLNQMGNCLIQGYLYSPPLPAKKLEAWIGARDKSTGLRSLTA